jgi:serine/threonine-protein kinase HipA
VTRALAVWWDGVIVGALRVDSHGDMTFRSAQEWLEDSSRPSLSISLPKRAEPFKRRATRAFFAGLLPEEEQRRVVARALGISRGNDFRLLEALGGDVAGALSFWPEGLKPPVASVTGKTSVLNDDELVELLDTLPKRPLLAGEKGLRLSLAGAQAKLPVVLFDGRVALPASGQATTHILKPALAHLPATTENEALVMALAAAIDLPVAAVEARVVMGRTYLLVTRYDRRFDAFGVATRLHQEDFCQALGIAPEHKYAEEGGPTFKACFELLRRVTTRPALDVLRLLDAAIFNVIVGNADAHGKSFSLLYDESGVTFAPLYDLLTTIAYPALSPRSAMKIARAATLEEIRANTWTAFAADAALAAPFVRRRVTALTIAVTSMLPAVVDRATGWGLDGAALNSQAALITSRATRLAATV